MAALGYIENKEKVFQNVKYVLKDRSLFVCSLPDSTNACITSKYLWNDPPETHNYFYIGRQDGNGKMMMNLNLSPIGGQ